jgi:phosphatidylglycerophosphatase A
MPLFDCLAGQSMSTTDPALAIADEVIALGLTMPSGETGEDK